jgi:hypothetical protein
MRLSFAELRVGMIVLDAEGVAFRIEDCNSRPPAATLSATVVLRLRDVQIGVEQQITWRTEDALEMAPLT